MAFHAPPERYRLTDHPSFGSTAEDGCNGAFICDSPEPGWQLALIASDGREPEGQDWEHVSVHAFQGRKLRTPSWREMAFVKDLCWEDEDVVMQLHPRRSEYVNAHPHVLHLWRSRVHPIPTPPSILVGPR